MLDAVTQACYAAGALVKDLVATFGVGQTTVQEYVRAHGLPRRSATVDQRQREITNLYWTEGSVSDRK